MKNTKGRFLTAVTVLLWGLAPQLYADTDTVIKFNSGGSSTVGTMTFSAEGIVISGTTYNYGTFTFDVQRSAISGSIDGGGSGEPAAQTSIAVDASAIARTYPDPIDLGAGVNPDVKDLANAEVTFSMPSYTYTGSALTPPFTVTYGATVLEAGTHYSAAYTYSNNIHAGSGTLTLTGIGDYANTSKTAYFTINKATLTVTADNATRVYGEENPTFTVSVTGFVGTDSESLLTTMPDATTDATATSDAGAYVIKTSGGTAPQDYKFDYHSGTLTVTPRDLSAATVSFDQERYPYTGSPVIPVCTVTDGQTTLTAGTDYTLTCSNNTQVGTAKATISGINNYTGQIDTTFVIFQEQLLTVIINGDSISPSNSTGTIQTYSSTYGSVMAQPVRSIAENAVWLYVTPATGYEVSLDSISMNVDYEVVEIGKNPTLQFLRPEDGEVTLTIVFTDPTISDLTSVQTASGELRVFDARGLLVTTATVGSSADIAACMAKLPAGLYILRINNQTIKIQKK